MRRHKVIIKVLARLPPTGYTVRIADGFMLNDSLLEYPVGGFDVVGIPEHANKTCHFDRYAVLRSKTTADFGVVRAPLM